MRNPFSSQRLALGTSIATLALLCAAFDSQAETRVTFKSAAAGTAYYLMGRDLADAIREGSDEAIMLTLEESQGSIQNVMEVSAREGNYVFTSPAVLIEQAMAGEGAFAEHPHPRFQEIRGLFPLPSMTMHFVLAGDKGSLDFSVLEGKHILIGRGTFGAREATRYLALFGLEGRVKIANAAIDSGPDAIKNEQIDGFVTASAYPSPSVLEAASYLPISLISLTDEQIEQTGATHQTIPGGTYPGINNDVHTTSHPVIAYTTTAMDEETAYTLTKTFWEHHENLAEDAPWWSSVSPEMLIDMADTLHPGARRYYQQAGNEIPDALRSIF